MVCSRLLGVVGEEPVVPITINNVKKIFTDSYKGNKTEFNSFIDRKKKYMENAAKSLLNFSYTLSKADKKWLYKEYCTFYEKSLNLDNFEYLFRDVDTGYLDDEEMSNVLFEEFQTKTAETFDTFGMSLVLWELIQATIKIKYLTYLPNNNFHFVAELRLIARQMCDPDCFSRIDILESTRLLDDVIGNLN
jgi:hypothetical protein